MQLTDRSAALLRNVAPIPTPLPACHLRYYSKSFKKDLPQCLDILSDILLNSVIDADALEVEKRVILREMEEVEKQTEEVIFDRLHMAVRKKASVLCQFFILASAAR